jgi:hypothetical protein
VGKCDEDEVVGRNWRGIELACCNGRRWNRSLTFTSLAEEWKMNSRVIQAQHVKGKELTLHDVEMLANF